MTCPRCQSEIDPAMGVCPQCGSPSQVRFEGAAKMVGMAPSAPSSPSTRGAGSVRRMHTPYAAAPGRPAELAGPAEIANSARPAHDDWRQQIRETVQRRKEMRKQQQAQREQVARQLTIFGDPSEAGRTGPVSEIERERDRIRQRRAEIRARVENKLAQPKNKVRAMVDAGEVAIHAEESGRIRDAGQSGQSRQAGRTGMAHPLGRSAAGAAAAAATLDIDFPEAPRAPEAPNEMRPSRRPAIGSDTIEHFELASPAERLLAGFIDCGLLSLLLLGLAYLTTNLVGQPLRALPGPALAALGCVGFILAAGYFLFFWSLSGQTLGKLLTSSRVVDPFGQPLGFGRALVRTLGVGLSILPLGAGFIGLWSDIGRRAWHDRLATTKVVRI